MMDFKRIVVPTDFSECSDFALNQAVRLAKRFGAQIVALHVAETLPPEEAARSRVFPGIAPLDREARAELQRGIDSFLALARDFGVRAEGLLREGNAAREIVRYARESGSDLVVMGTHGREGFERFMIGSVTEKVLRKSPVPVLTVSGKAERPIAEGEVPFRTILVPVDFSGPSKRAVGFSSELVRGTDARLILLHVVEILPDWEARELSHFNVPEFARHLEKEALDLLRRMAPEGAPHGPAPETLVARGKSYVEILRVAKERSADLIVMGMQGRGALDLMLFGSTTGHVVRAAACPVLAIRGA